MASSEAAKTVNPSAEASDSSFHTSALVDMMSLWNMGY